MATNEEILKGYPKSEDYINTGSGFNTGDGDPIRRSYEKTNESLRKLDQEKANLSDVEFSGTIKGPNVIVTGEKDLYITLKDIENYLKNEAEGELLLMSPIIDGTTSVINQLDNSGNYSVVVTKNDLDNFIQDYAPKESPTFTGSKPTWNDGSEDFTLATENFVSNKLTDKADKESPTFSGSQPVWDNGNETYNLIILNDVVEFLEDNSSQLNISSSNITFDNSPVLSNGATMLNQLRDSPDNESSLITIDDLNTWFFGEGAALDVQLENQYGLEKDVNDINSPLILDNSANFILRNIEGDSNFENRESGLRISLTGENRDLRLNNFTDGDIEISSFGELVLNSSEQAQFNFGGGFLFNIVGNFLVDSSQQAQFNFGDGILFNTNQSFEVNTSNNTLTVPSSQGADLLYNNEEIPTADRVSELVEIADFYDVTPIGHRIYVSSLYGSDWNYGFTPQTAVKSIKQAAINAYALQAPNTLDGNLRKDAYRTLEWNRNLIVEEIGLIANSNPETRCMPNVRSPKTYRDIDDLYGAISKDILLDTNRNIRLVLREIFEAGANVSSVWTTQISIDGEDTNLFNHLLTLMSSVLYSKDSSSSNRAQANDFPATWTFYGEKFVTDRLTLSRRNDSEVNTEALVDNSVLDSAEQLQAEPCTYLRQQILSLNFPSSIGDIDNSLPYKTPNQVNNTAYSVIRIESGTYKEDFPIELPDNVSVFGDSLRRVAIMPTDDLKEKGCGLHQRFLSNTFTRLALDNEAWDPTIVIDYPKSGSARPAAGTLFDIGDNLAEIRENIIGRRYRLGLNNPLSEVRNAEFIGNSTSTLLRLTFRPPTYGVDQNTPNSIINIIDEDENFEQNTLIESDLFLGYLILRNQDGEPLRLTGSTYNRGDRVTPTFKFKNGTTNFKLRKGDVIAVVDTTNFFRRELIRVERHEEINNQGDLANFFLSVPHRFNEGINLEDAYLYIAPRAEWQTMCEQRIFERGFSNSNNTYPSTEVVTNTAEVGQNAIHVGNANYVFQVVYKEHTNFSYAFRRDRPRVFASPYVQNCSSITTKGGGGILVDGFIPRQPDEDFPQPIRELSVPEDIFSSWNEEDSGDINKALNMHYDGQAILEAEEENIVSILDEDPVDSTLQDLMNSDVNYTSKEKCKEDARLLLSAIREQMLKGGNDKVYDAAKIIETVIFNQVKDTEIPLQSFNRIMQAYSQVIGKLEEKAVDLIHNNPNNVVDVVSGDCSGVEATVKTLFDVIRRILLGNPSGGKYYDGAFALLADLDEGDNSTLMSLFDSQNVKDALSQLGSQSGYDGQIDKCRRDLRFLVAAIEWHLPRGGNYKVVEAAETIQEAVGRQDDGNPDNLRGEIRDAYRTVLEELRSRLDTVIKNEPFNGSVQSGDCQDVVNTAQSYVDDMIKIIVDFEFVSRTSKNEISRNNFKGTPGVEINKRQNAELRSFVLDAFTQINTFGGWGHLIRNNGYAQLVSTFTTFCDHGVKVESGGLINLSNSVSDFGFFGLLADGTSRTSYISGQTFDSVKGAKPGDIPSSEFYIDPRTLNFNPLNPVYSERANNELSQLISDYNDARDTYESQIEDNNLTQEQRELVENLRKRLERLAVNSIQFNSSILFEASDEGSIYNFRRNDQHLTSDRQIPRSLAYVDRADDVNPNSLRAYRNTNANELDLTEEFMIKNPTIRVGVPVNQRIPNATDVGLENTPTLEEGVRVDFYITTTLTSSSHGFEYVGSGNDYSNALPENGGVPDASKQLLETNGGKVFTSSTDVRGDFRVGNFFTVKQSTGAVSFNPSSLELVNITSIGPFRNKGVVGSNVIKDLTDNFSRLIPEEDNNPLDDSTVATVASIKGALNDTFQTLSNNVSTALLRSQSNAKLLESVQNPIPDFGSWAGKHSIYHRSYQLLDKSNNVLEGFGKESNWPSVRDFDSYLYEMGGKTYAAAPDIDDANEFVNRSSFTFNFVIDGSESMSQTGKFWQVKKDLVNFAYNIDEKDSIAIYNFSDSVMDTIYITVNSNVIFDHLGTEDNNILECFHPNPESNSRVAYIVSENNNKKWYNVSDAFNERGISFNDSTYYKVGEATVDEIIEEGTIKKIKLVDVKGYFDEELLVRIKSESDILVLNPGEEVSECPEGYDCLAEDEVEIIEEGEDCPEGFICFNRVEVEEQQEQEQEQNGDLETRAIIETVEHGILPKIFNSSINTEEIRTSNPTFDFSSAMRNSILRELGVTLPDTSKVNNDKILEPQVWGTINNGDYNQGIFNSNPWGDSRANIAPGPSNFANPDSSTDDIWSNDPTAFDPIDPSTTFPSGNKTSEHWFYADIDPLNVDSVNDINNRAVTSKFEYLPPRTSVNGQNLTDYRISDISIFGKYDPENNTQGFLTASDINSDGVQFLKEIKSTPLLDFGLVAHDHGFNSDDAEAQARAMRGLMGTLDELGIFDWKVGKLSAAGGVDSNIYIRDFYLSDTSEFPRKELFKDSSNEFKQGRDRELVTGSDRRDVEYQTFQFASDNNGSPDTDNLHDTTSPIGTSNRFWITNTNNGVPPVHRGSTLTLQNIDTIASIDYSSLPFNSPLDEITVNSSENLGPGDSITISFGSRTIGGDSHEFSVNIFLTVDDFVGRDDGSVTVPIQENAPNGLSDLINMTSNTGNPVHDGTLRTTYQIGEFTSGDTHPMFMQTLPKGTEIKTDENGQPVLDEDGNLIEEEVDITFDFPGEKHRASVEESGLDVEVIDVRYPTNGDSNTYLLVEVTGTWEKPSGATKVLFGSMNMKVNEFHQTLIFPGEPRGDPDQNQSTMKRISDACIELNWRPNSTKILSVLSSTNFSNELPYWGGFYFAANSGLSLGNRVLLRRFDYVLQKYMKNDARALFEGEGIQTTFDQLLSGAISLPNNLYDDGDFTSFIDEISESLMSNNAPVHAWYLGYNLNAGGDSITDSQGNTAPRGGVNRAGKAIVGSTGNPIGPDDYASYSAVEEDLIFGDISQLHLAVRDDLYYTPGNLFFMENSSLSFGGLLSLHNVTNFNENTVNAITRHRAGISEFSEIASYEADTGSGVVFNDDGTTSTKTTDFTSNWENKKATLPKGQWRNFFDIRRSNWLKNLNVEIVNALGEGQGILYSEFGNDGNISEEHRAEDPPGYKELISDKDEFNGEVNGVTIGYVDDDINLVKNPTPAIMPSPSIGKDLLINASNASPVPGLTLKGKSAIYEAFATATKDASLNDERLLYEDPRPSVISRNPAREGTINVTAIISDGQDNASFEDAIIKHFINYDSNGYVNVNATLTNLFYELFMDKAGNIQLNNGVPVQQKFIYTSEVINTLHILSFALAGNSSLTEVRVKSNSGFRDDNYDLPFRIFSNNNFDSSTRILDGNGVQENIPRMVSDIFIPLEDEMGLMPPFYRGSSDAIRGLVATNRIKDSRNTESLSTSDIFPNPYRFVAYSFPANQSKQFRGDVSIPETSNIFTNLGEIGPSIRFSINLSPLNLDENMRYNNRSDLPEETKQYNLPSEVTVSINSKLGYLHNITPNIEQQGIASQIVIFDTGFGQKTSKASQVLSQNLGGVDGTPFRQPGQIVLNELQKGNIVKRNRNGFPDYEQNTSASLVEQRINYIENAFRGSAQISKFTSGYPLISRRYVGTETSGEYLGNIKNVEGELFASRVDTNGNNRNAILRFNPNSNTWRQSAGVDLGTGGTNQEIIGFQNINFDGANAPVALIKDKTDNESRIVVRSNEVWQNLIDSSTLFFDPIRDPDLQNPIKLNIQAGEYFNQIFQETETIGEETITYTYVSVSFSGGGFILCTSDSLTSLSVSSNTVTWLLANHQPNVLRSSEEDLYFSILELDTGELSENTIFALFDGTYDNPGSLAGFYKFDFDIDLNRDNYFTDSNIIMDPDPNNDNFDPSSEFYLTLSGERGTWQTTRTFIEIEGFREFDIEEKPDNTGQGPDQHIMTVIGDPKVATNDEGEASHSGIYVALREDGNPIYLEDRSRWNRIERLRSDGNFKPGKGAFRKLTYFDNTDTIGGEETRISRLILDNTQNLGPMVSLSVNNHNRHIGVLTYNNENLNDAKFYIAEYSGLTVSPPTSSWTELLSTFGQGFGFPVGSNTNAKLLNYFTTENYLVFAFGDNTRAPVVPGADGPLASGIGLGNKLCLMSLPVNDITQDGEVAAIEFWPFTNSNLVSQRDSQKSATDGQPPDEFYIDCFYGDNSDDIFTVDGHTQSLDPAIRYVSRYSIDSDGINNSVFNLMFRIEENLDEDGNLTGVSISTGDGPSGNVPDGQSVTTINNVNSIDDVKLSGVSYLDPYYYFSFAVLSSNESVIIRRHPTDDTDWSIEIDTEEGTIPFRPAVDPNVYPKYPHGENWFRDGAVGVNQGSFVADPKAPIERNFSWNSSRYINDLLYATIRNTIENYQSAI